MAYNYLGLVNDINNRVNEVELTSANFAGAIGFYSDAKQAVNSAIQQINFMQFEWPFNHVTNEENLSTNEARYFFPTDMKTADMDSFRIKKSISLGNETSKLRIISYEEYLDKFVDQEYDTTNSQAGLPRYVFRTPDNGFGVVPKPDKNYSIVYEYYKLSTPLVNYDDVPNIPENFRSIIVDGAMAYVYMFRSDPEASQLSLQKFDMGIKDMRTIYINRYDYVRSTVIQR